jgi:signal transduction histidine kinase
LLLYLTCLLTGVYITFKGIKQAYFYLLAWSFMITGAFIFFAVVNGFFPFNPFTRNTLYFGVAMEVWLFSLALGDRLNVLQREKNDIKAENLEIIKGQNEILETKVSNRTKDLEAANEELMQSNEELLLTSEQLNYQSSQLKKINHTKDHLFAIISHDLRSPINSLKGLMNLVWGHNISKEEFFKFSKNLKHGIEHAHFTLNNLLNWAKSQMEGMKTKPENFNLHASILENKLLLQEPLQNKNIEVIIDIESDIEVYADPDHINLVTRNLLSNALKFTDKGGEIKISASLQSPYCEIAVADTGVGMSNQSLDNLFSNESSNSQLGTAGEKGTGLGLILCKDFVEKNGGTIRVESKEGAGTTFYFTLLLIPSA